MSERVKIINERTSGYVSVAMIGPDGDAALPTAVTYRIDDVETGQEIRGNTEAAPAATVGIALTPDDTRILGERRFERRLLTVRATYGGGNDALHSEYEFAVRNLRHAPLDGVDT